MTTINTPANATTLTDAVPALLVPVVETRKLETETCGRCGGSGHYSYCQMYGTRCFKCGGGKVVYTKRGAAARKYLETLRCKPARELKVGDRIKAGAVTMGGTPYDQWVVIKAITTGVQTGSSLIGGEMVAYRREGLDIETDKVVLCCVDPDAPIRFAQTNAQKAETLRLALDYQDTLTKAGTPRKRG